MNFIESDSGRLINLDHIVDLFRLRGGEWKVRFSDGTVDVFTSTDGDAVRAAVKKPKPGRPPKPKTT